MILEKIAKEENWKNLGNLGSYAAAWGAFAVARPGCQNGTLGYTTA